MENNSSQTSSLGIKEDPAQLFSRFSPTLLFDAPARIADKSEWYLIAEQAVPTSRTEFWSTIKRWTAEPQLVIPPIEKAELLSARSTENIIYRQMIPKRKTKDASFLEVVSYQGKQIKNRVIYRPDRPESLPFFYPKVLRVGNKWHTRMLITFFY
ncbi:hypothetical protein BX666DRAFT_1863947 [Dichotomocladium elegans]|nr:hypothetical protein BX666DRAFT_1863947 [Dichotomocladium elegans]